MPSIHELVDNVAPQNSIDSVRDVWFTNFEIKMLIVNSP